MEPFSRGEDAPLVSIVLPAYNEELALADDMECIIETMVASDYTYELIVVDDGSTDKTADIAAGFPGVHVIRHERNRGPGAARSTGMRAARGQIVAMTDADGTYPNQELPRLIDHVLAGADMAVGAREVEAGTLKWLRVPAKEFIRWLASYLTDTDIPDLNSGFRAVRREVGLRFLPILPNTHSWVSTITLALLSNSYRVDYFSIEYYPRVGHSSFHPIRDTYNYLSLVLRAITYFNPLKIFLPVSLILFSAGVVRALYNSFVVLDFKESDVVILVVALLIGMMGLLADLIVVHGRARYMVDHPPEEYQPARSQQESASEGSETVPAEDVQR